MRDDKNYEDEIYSVEQEKIHKESKENIFTVDGVPSRWEHNKARSTWHYDPFREPEPDVFIVPVRFTNDFTEVNKFCLENDPDLESMQNYRPREKSRQDKDLHDAELLDLKRATGKDDLTVFWRQRLIGSKIDENGNIQFKRRSEPEFDIFYSIMDWLEVEVHQSRVHIQKLGQVMPIHIDQQVRYNRPGYRDLWLKKGADKNPLLLRRFLIMLQDWTQGHVWQFGNTYYQGYKSGSCITYDWCNIPHGTANFSYTPRLTLQITGFVSEKTQWLIDHPSPTREVHL